jgi:hypothetical protein
VPFAREAEIVLAIWREAERKLVDATPGSSEADALESEILMLRTEYQRLTELAREHHRPEPPPFPETF